MDEASGSPEFLNSSQSMVEEILDSEPIDDFNNDCDSDYSCWIDLFCSCAGNEFFVTVDEDYIKDDFNLKDLDAKVPRFKQAWYMILNFELNGGSSESDEVQTSAGLLYGLVHARFILTQKGMQLMEKKYSEKLYGKCPNVNCCNMSVLPVGLSDNPFAYTAKVFCPSCKEVYNPPVNSLLGNLDGAFFGTSFPHIFLLQYPVEVSPINYYVPKIYGFRIHRKVKDLYREQKN